MIHSSIIVYVIVVLLENRQLALLILCAYVCLTSKNELKTAQAANYKFP